MQFLTRMAQDMGGENTREAKDKRAQIWRDMRFIAFDSFEGLPELSPEDLHSVDFKKGQYAFSEKKFIRNVIDQGIPAEKLITVKGYFDKTCIDETKNKLFITKVSVVWLDADLYSSTRDVLKFLTPVLQDGTVLVFDDWFSFKGNPTRGVQKAFYEWANDLTSKFLFTEYQRESWKRMSFIVSTIASA